MAKRKKEIELETDNLDLDDSKPLDEWAAPDEETSGVARPGMLRTAADVKRFVLAGKATLTIRSKVTGTRYTYNVHKPKPDSPYFVKVMYGPNNEEDYVYMGTMFEDGTVYRQTKKSALKEDDARVRAWVWLWERILAGKLPEDKVEVWHEDRCGRCGRKLTVPESIERGIGPECASM
jgi:hypothetical protein